MSRATSTAVRRSIAATLVAVAGSAYAAEPITGRPSVTDGDTVVIQDTKIRLHGIDAPESAQTCQDAAGKDYRCGQAAANALSDHIGQANVTCEPRDTDRYGRTVAVCRKGREDLNAWMVRQGHAVAYRRYAEDYVAAEGEAKVAKRGIWAGTFQEPQDWRRAQRGGEPQAEESVPRTAPPALAAGGCQVKGNISAKGERIYHLPGSSSYAKTRIDEADGERMFCTEDEAKAAGWRAPRG